MFIFRSKFWFNRFAHDNNWLVRIIPRVKTYFKFASSFLPFICIFIYYYLWSQELKYLLNLIHISVALSLSVVLYFCALSFLAPLLRISQMTSIIRVYATHHRSQTSNSMIKFKLIIKFWVWRIRYWFVSLFLCLQPQSCLAFNSIAYQQLVALKNKTFCLCRSNAIVVCASSHIVPNSN